MSEGFWLVFWGVIATLLGAAIAAAVQWIWWAGALIGLLVYLVILAFIYSGGEGASTFIFMDFD